MSRKEIIERERRLARPVAFAAGAPLILFFASLLLRSELTTESGIGPEVLRTINEHNGAVIFSGILAGLAYAAMAAPLTYLFRAAAVRIEKGMLTGLIGLCVVGPLLFGLQSVLGSLAQVSAARDFVEQEQGVGDIYSLAENLLSEQGLMSVAQAVGAAGLLSLIFAIVYTALWAMRAGLLTRFSATLGMALAVGLILGPLAQTVLPVMFMWFAYVGLVIAGRPPGGRPPAWDAGVAIPWPRPGEEAEQPPSADDGVIEGDATEIPGLEDESPNAARRARAKARKRKRKRRT
ncbi:MAG TPA: hypothetical protein VIL04_09025 [Solirubrobacterales bacterium]